jgi:hypothetical protein
MTGHPKIKVVLQQRVLRGSNQPDVLQRVGTVYIDGQEYRVSAPPEATGDALNWLPHLSVRQMADVNSEIEVHDAPRVLALSAVKHELEKRDSSSIPPANTPPNNTPDGDSGPLSVLKQSIKHVPANKYAFGVVGIVAAASSSIVLAGGKWQAAVAGGVVMFAGMVLLRVFSGKETKTSLQPGPPLATQALTWFCLVAFAVVLSLFIGKLYVMLFPPADTVSSVLKLPLVPPDRLLTSSPFRARLDDCTLKTCDVDFILRGYDPKGRLRYDAHDSVKKWVTGQFRDTAFNTVDKLYFQHTESISFQLFCRLNAGSWLVGENVALDWKELNEKSDGPAYFVWPTCGNADFKASVGIAVRAAKERLNEPAVKEDPGQPGNSPLVVPGSVRNPESHLKLMQFTLVLRNDVVSPQFYVNDQERIPISYSSGIATLQLPTGSYLVRAEYPNWTCFASVTLPLENQRPVSGNCKLK